MARGFAAGGNYYTVAKSYSGASAFSAAAWIYYTATGNTTIAGLWEGAGNQLQWLLSKNTSNQTIVAIYDYDYRVVTGGSLSTSAWNHIALTFSATDGLRSFINGSEVGNVGAYSANLASRTDSFGVGARQAGNEQWSGQIAEFATWTTRLAASQVASLAKGFSPAKVLKPDCYIPLVRDVADIANKYAITTVGSPTVENHPRIYK